MSLENVLGLIGGVRNARLPAWTLLAPWFITSTIWFQRNSVFYTHCINRILNWPPSNSWIICISSLLLLNCRSSFAANANAAKKKQDNESGATEKDVNHCHCIVITVIRRLGCVVTWHSETNKLFQWLQIESSLHIHSFIIRGQVKRGQSRVLWNKSWWHWGWEIWWICRSRWWKGRERWRWSILILSCIQWVAGCTGLCMSGLA